MADDNVDRILQGIDTQTNARVQYGLDANPDDAARAVELSDSTGVPSTVVNSDLENFDNINRGKMARSIVQGNDYLQSYVRSHPLAASISNDDWGNLDRISRSASWLGQISKALDAGWQSKVGQAVEEGAREGFGTGPIFPVTTEGLARQYPALAPGRSMFSGSENLALTGALNIGDLALRSLISAPFSAVASGIGALAGTVGGESAAREAKALTEYEGITPEAHGLAALQLPGATEPMAEGTTVRQEGTFGHPQETVEPPGAPWIKAGRVPPPGVSPEVDRALARINSQHQDVLDEVTTDTQTNSSTWERNPQFMQKWFFDRNQDLRDTSIGINGDAVAALYGNKVPAPGDGLLGWLPGIADKLELARKTGADVDVPISAWISHVDPEVAKQLHDYIRMWDGGITADEARRPLPTVAPGGDLAQVREASGLNPVPAEAPKAEAEGGLTPAAVGLDLKSFEKIQADLAERRRSDTEATQKFAEKEQQRRQSAEWKDNKSAMLEAAEADFRKRPDVLADLLVGAGEIGGEKVRQRIPLREGDLTAEQQASLPKHYVAINGLPIDEAARITGFSSGDEMVEALSRYIAGKELGVSPRDHFRKLVDTEANVRMETKYGKLAENVLTAARDQAFSENDLHLLVYEYLSAALKAGVTTVGKDEIRAEALADIGKIPLKSAKSFTYEREVAKQYRLAVNALIAENPADALHALQRRVYNAFMTAELRKKEAAKEQFLGLAKTYSKLPTSSTDNPTAGRDPATMDYIHQILIQVGLPVRRRSIQAIQASIDAHGYGTLEQFTATKAAWLRQMPVWDQLFDESWSKDYKDLTVDEFDALHATLKSMDYNARGERTIEVNQDKANLADKKEDLIDTLKRFPELKYTAAGTRAGLAGKLGRMRGFIASVVQIESLLNMFDKFNPWGAWNQYVMRGLIDGANQVDRWEKDYVPELRKLDDGIDLTKDVVNPLFRNMNIPNGKGPLLPFTRENLRAVLVKSGNSSGPKSNLFKLAHGYGLEPQAVMDWLHQHATKEDWDYAQGVWDLWASIKEKGDTMFRSMSGGVAPDMVKLTPIQTKFGTYKGGYYPANDWHPEFGGTSKTLSGEAGLLQPDFVSATAMPGWTKSRTGYSAPQRLDLDNMANLIKQHLHDIAMRPALVNASKILLDKDIQAAIKTHIGSEYAGLMRPYLEALANRTSYASRNPDYANSWAEYLRTNLVTTLVGANISTVAKHFFTAFGTSIREAGPEYYLKATRMMYAINEETGETNKKFLDREFLELSRRSRNWQETLYGEMANQIGGPANKYETLRQQVARLSSAPVAFSDMLTARPTALAAYMKAIDEGMSHGDAVYAGERAVRRAHGSTAITNRPAIMRDKNPWITSIYNFFNDIFNRQLETLWRAGEMVRDAKADDWPEAKKQIPAITGNLFAYVIWPAVVEQVVASILSPGQKGTQDESWTKKLVKGLVHTESATLPYVRDIANLLFEGGEPTLGLTGTALKEIRNAWGDFGKKEPFSPQHAERMIHDFGGVAGLFTGYLPQAVTNVGEFGYGIAAGIERPKGPWGWLIGTKSGTLHNRPSTLENWWEGKRW